MSTAYSSGLSALIQAATSQLGEVGGGGGGGEEEKSRSTDQAERAELRCDGARDVQADRPVEGLLDPGELRHGGHLHRSRRYVLPKREGPTCVCGPVSPLNASVLLYFFL